ncbi:solute carrier family 25 member 35-like [Zophobas morio]|uniref:solute carrier family 25 member 35-like n=1 Tax=Zophobas morio TaxID=2755281 RepID=UPI003082D55C
MDFCVGAVAAMASTLVTNPLDVIKTRAQLQGELTARGYYVPFYNDSLQSMRMIIQKEGFLALQKGLLTSILHQGVRNGVKLGLYEWLSFKGFLCDDVNTINFYNSLMASAFGGGMGALLTTPLYRLSTQFQARAAPEIAVGYQHRHSGLVQALMSTYRTSGVQVLWKGTNANLVRSVVGAAAQLTTFSHVKEVLRDYEVFRYSRVLTAFVAGTFGGMCQTIFQTPFDLVCIRLNNQYVYKNGKGALYQGMLHCFYKIIRYEGLFALYKGLPIFYVKNSRHTTLYLIVWELLKAYQHDVLLIEDSPHSCYHDPDDI